MKRKPKNLEDPLVKIAQDIKENPMEKDDCLIKLSDYMNEMNSRGSNFKHFEDFACYKIMQDKSNVIEAAAELEKIINCLAAEENKKHPMVIHFNQVLGFNGFKRMS